MTIEYIKQWVKIRIKYCLNYVQMYHDPPVETLVPGNKYAFIFFAADYNNLGDIAITVAQERFLRVSLGDFFRIVKIPESETYKWVRQIRKLPQEDVLITLVGGGNNGSLYEFIEEPRRFVLRSLKRYKIISFPQTVVFENTFRALPYKQEFLRLCKKCSDLTLVARERNSYDFYNKIKGVRVLLTPDIVFSYPYETSNKRDQNAVAFILRTDKEKLLTPEREQEWIAAAKSLFPAYHMWDTCSVLFEHDREEFLVRQYLDQLSKIRLAVTDRLHGMILCYLSKTPCIVIENNNGKIRSTFETWMKNQNYVRLFSADGNVGQFLQLAKELSSVKPVMAKTLLSKFESLNEVLK